MIDFLWHVPVFLWELAINLFFWGSVIGLLVLKIKWGTEKWIDTLKSERKAEESDQGNKDNWGV